MLRNCDEISAADSTKEQAMSNNLIEKELEFFDQKYDSLIAEYRDQWIAMKNGEILHAGTDKNKVLEATLKDENELGTFLFRQVLPKSQYSQRYFSRVL